MESVCKRCQSPHIYEPTGICLECGFRNKPVADLEAEERRAREKREKELIQKKQEEEAAYAEKVNAVREMIRSGFDLIESGRAGEAGPLLGELAQKIGAFDLPELALSFMKLQAAFFKARGITGKYMEVLKKLVPQIDFVPENYAYFYDLGVAYQDRGNQAAARKLFDRFMENWIVDYEDVKNRYEKSCSAASIPGTGADGQIHVRTGAFELEAELIRKWIDAAGSENRYFSSAILLNNDKEDTEVIEDLPAAGKPSRKKVMERLAGMQGGIMSGFSAQKETIRLFRGDQDAGEEIPCILFVPRESSARMQRGGVGMVRIAARIVGFDRIKVVFYVLFQPHSPEEAEGMAPRDFNERIRRAVQPLHPVENDHELVTLVEAFKRSMVAAVKAELVAQGGGPEFF